MEKRKPKLHYKFSVQLTETVTIGAPDEEVARALLAQGFSYGGPARKIDWEGEARVLKQDTQQNEIELLSVEDPMATWKSEHPVAEEDRLFQEGLKKFERQLNDNFRDIFRRLEAIEAAIGKPGTSE